MKKNMVPTTKLINVATNAVVFFPSSPFIKASKDVDTPANVANIIANKSYDTSYLLMPKFEVYKNIIIFSINIKLSSYLILFNGFIYIHLYLYAFHKPYFHLYHIHKDKYW